MEADWDSWAQNYARLTSVPASGPSAHQQNQQTKKLVGLAASRLPKDNESALEWHIQALQDPVKRWFVARVASVSSPLPHALLDPMLKAALEEPNPSSAKHFVEPCVRSFGATAIQQRVQALAGSLGLANGLENVMYWVPRQGT